jgi:hypothetical protein
VSDPQLPSHGISWLNSFTMPQTRIAPRSAVPVIEFDDIPKDDQAAITVVRIDIS